METSKKTAVLEITDDSAKFAIGYAVGGQPVVIYKTERSLKGLVKDGYISDQKAVVDIIKEFAHIEDEAASLKINAHNLSIIIPPLGFQIYQNAKSTTLTSSSGLIDYIDITNLNSMLMNDKIPGDNLIVDIIPDFFTLDDGKNYSNPPLGEKSHSIAIRAKIHTLPEPLVHAFRATVEAAGFRIKDASVAPYCASQLIGSDKSMPENYFLLDMGARLTTISIVGASSPYSSLFFPRGGDDLTDAIATGMGLSFAEAEKIKRDYGFDERTTSYEAPVAVSADSQGRKTKYFQSSLNTVIEDFFEDWNAHFANAIAKLSARQPTSQVIASMPVVAIGGGSELKGLAKLVAPTLGARRFIAYVPTALGARDPRFANVLGLILAESHYRGTLEENYHGVSSLSRERQ
ncbi:MAG: hypothetical protein LKG11_06550 [Bacilli bacterium]|jgi:cell division protein FtsA|nr:hypothetical protein [Bacilli bacterium]